MFGRIDVNRFAGSAVDGKISLTINFGIFVVACDRAHAGELRHR